MQFITTATLIAVAVASSAPVVTSNPNTRFVADFPFAGSQAASGFVVFAVGDSGQVNVHVDLTKLPATGGEFSYKIHDRPVGWGAATCDSAGAVFDPYHAGNVDCDSLADDSRCPVGDLSGKHGRFTATCFEHSYIDPYLSLDPASEAYIGGRSVVVYHDGQVLACATIQAETEGDQNGDQEGASVDSVVELPSIEVALPTAVPPIATDVIVTEEETIKTLVETIETSVETIETSVGTIETSLESTDSLAETTFPSRNSTVASTLTSEVSSVASSSAGSVPPEVTQETNMGSQLASSVAAMVAMVAMLL
ncbi:hypothetical protein DIURU_002525 [Diutina rugosa]|uniref:Superoxide dismutase copper/zinc binding domain-containing protein n=1 Tax=Diutina rugosa TaxID=5481 RepID=A0A642UWF8_DIURU|nr:uncharacterized protein DIURU_002525 [Diutina rugosa]KAA8903238.1 hypothetical protein DIURU_002525 [Diutina rugosa]